MQPKKPKNKKALKRQLGKKSYSEDVIKAALANC